MNAMYISLAVALVCFILYALDCRSRESHVDWFSALKVTTLGGVLSGGIAYALTSGDIELLKAVVPEVPQVQEMFVGTPTF